MATFTTSDNTKIFYEVDGEGEQTILFSCGGGCTTKYFDPIVPGLAKKCRVVRYDFRGHGGTERTDGVIDADRMVKDVRELIEHLDIKHLYLAGWSLGAMICMLYVEKYGEEGIDGIVYVDMTPLNMARTEEDMIFTNGGKVNPEQFMSMLYGYNKLDPNGDAKMKRFFGDHPEDHMDMKEIFERESKRVAPAYRMAVNIMGANQDTREIMKKINLPVLHMFGTAHKVKSKAAVEFMAKHVKNIRQVSFEGCGHAMFMEMPEKFDQEVLNFMGL